MQYRLYRTKKEVLLHRQLFNDPARLRLTFEAIEMEVLLF